MTRGRSNSSSSSLWFLFVTTSLVMSLTATAVVAYAVIQKRKDRRRSHAFSKTNNTPTTSIAFLGNSMIYYNDCPRLVQIMMQVGLTSSDCPAVVHQDSCLRGGVTLRQLWDHGNGMRNKFGKESMGAPTVQELLLQQEWNAMILNDHTLSPTRESSAQDTRLVLQQYYRTLFLKAAATSIQKMTLLFLQTPAYRKEGIRDTNDLGDFEAMTEAVRKGVQSFVDTLLLPTDSTLPYSCVVAPVGDAYRQVRQQDQDLWEQLYCHDDFHPSPCGTWLQACVILHTRYSSCSDTPTTTPTPQQQRLPLFTREQAQSILKEWSDKARYWQPTDNVPLLPLPSIDQALELEQIARACVATAAQSKE